ncbi:MAG TPA: hypothetical protein VG346_01700 [Acidimicrobiales bacterium]|jgi:hypothetical protein|nr:hypothetical protein [Acidimicrobiales bacterium]
MHVRSWHKLVSALAGAVLLSGTMVTLGAAAGTAVVAGASTSHSLGAAAPADFGGVTLGDFVVETAAVTNNNSSGTITVAGDEVSGANPDDFFAFPDPGCQFVDNNFDIVLAPGQSCNLDYFFNPGAIGTRTATVTLFDNSSTPIPLAAVPVSGTGSIGYYQVSDSGQVAPFGDAGFYGDASQMPLNHPIVGMAQTGDDGGYWLAASDGGIFNYGDATFEGSAGGMHLNKPIVGMASTGDGQGYWLVATDGGIFTYGDAPFDGSTGAMALNKPIVGMAATNDGGGYWLVASDGGIFAFGDAQFYGSTGSMHLNQPIVGMASTPDGRGYWLVAADGGIFAFGDAPFYGSAGNLHLNQPITGMAAMPDGSGYWFTAADGGLFSYGAPFYGSAASQGIGRVVGMATDGFPTAQAQNDAPAARHHDAPREGGWTAPPSGELRHAGP